MPTRAGQARDPARRIAAKREGGINCWRPNRILAKINHAAGQLPIKNSPGIGSKIDSVRPGTFRSLRQPVPFHLGLSARRLYFFCYRHLWQLDCGVIR